MLWFMTSILWSMKQYHLHHDRSSGCRFGSKETWSPCECFINILTFRNCNLAAQVYTLWLLRYWLQVYSITSKKYRDKYLVSDQENFEIISNLRSLFGSVSILSIQVLCIFIAYQNVVSPIASRILTSLFIDINFESRIQSIVTQIIFKIQGLLIN